MKIKYNALLLSFLLATVTHIGCFGEIDLGKKISTHEDKKKSYFNEQELLSAIKSVYSRDSIFNNVHNNEVLLSNEQLEELAKQLAKYKVNGFSIAYDPNFGFIYDHQNPSFDVVFKNDKGDIKTRRFNGSIYSLGCKAQFALNLNFIFFIGTDFNYLDAQNSIKLGVGCESHFPGFGWIYAPFCDMPGGMLILMLSVGLSSGFSIVTGGSLTPA